MEERSYLITGASGSFGNAFTKHLLNSDLADRVVVFSRDEVKQAEMRERFNNDHRLRFFIGDIRDKDRLRRAFSGVDVVINAAALKRVEVGEYCPDEVVKTNIIGSLNVIEASIDANIKKVVFISSDKACSPLNAYGASKLMAEKLFLAANNMRGADGPKFAVCRYGNVWCSRGSIVPKWCEMIKTSDTVPVTSLDATRYFMHLSEACQLVYETIKTMQGGEMKIPNLPAYRVGDLVEAMGVNANVIGLPSSEKMHESMIEGQTSEHARRMTVDELRQHLSSYLKAVA